MKGEVDVRDAESRTPPPWEKKKRERKGRQRDNKNPIISICKCSPGYSLDLNPIPTSHQERWNSLYHFNFFCKRKKLITLISGDVTRHRKRLLLLPVCLRVLQIWREA